MTDTELYNKLQELQGQWGRNTSLWKFEDWEEKRMHTDVSIMMDKTTEKYKILTLFWYRIMLEATFDIPLIKPPSVGGRKDSIID